MRGNVRIISQGFQGLVSQGLQELYLRVRRSGPETTIDAGTTSGNRDYRSTYKLVD